MTPAITNTPSNNAFQSVLRSTRSTVVHAAFASVMAAAVDTPSSVGGQLVQLISAACYYPAVQPQLLSIALVHVRNVASEAANLPRFTARLLSTEVIDDTLTHGGRSVERTWLENENVSRALEVVIAGERLRTDWAGL